MSEMSNLSAYKMSFLVGTIERSIFWWNKLTEEEKAQVEPPYDYEDEEEDGQGS